MDFLLQKKISQIGFQKKVREKRGKKKEKLCMIKKETERRRKKFFLMVTKTTTIRTTSDTEKIIQLAIFWFIIVICNFPLFKTLTLINARKALSYKQNDRKSNLNFQKAALIKS